LATLVARRSPPPRLIPYTTLFRSHGNQGIIRFGRYLAALCPFPQDIFQYRKGLIGVSKLKPEKNGHQTSNNRPDHSRYKELAGEDRKSTRLNSSHAKISYAVFCLK